MSDEKIILNDDFLLSEEALTKKIKEENQINPLADFQVTNPFSLDMNINKDDDTERSAFYKKKAEAEKPFNIDMNEIIPVIRDILDGDIDALHDPQFSCLNLANIKAAIDWLYNNNSISDGMKGTLSTEAWRLAFRAKPPTAEEFLTTHYIGPQAENMYDTVRKHFIESFNPMRPYRTTVLTPHIGWGKPQPMYTEIRTPNGLCKLGDLHIGDKVETPEGKEATIIKEWPQGEIDTYEITFDDGRTAECGIGHLWKVSYRKDVNDNKIWELVTTQFMIDNADFEFEIPDTSYFA